MTEFTHFLFQVGLCCIFFAAYTPGNASDESSARVKRSLLAPVLTMDISFENVTDYLRHGDHYGYVTTLKHSESPRSAAAAKGVHVTWMLAPIIKFLNIVSYTGPDPPIVQHMDDSVTLKIAELLWGAEFTVSFKVEFDPERTLKPSNYSLVTPVHLSYYDDYLENPEGSILSKGRYFSHPLEKVAFNIELPGCSEPLGMKSERINDYQITASSSYEESQPSRARETEDAWCAKTIDQDQYLQVDFLLKTRVTRVGIMRRKTKDHWVTKYSLQYSNDDTTWFNYTENGHVKVFKGPQTASDTDIIIHYLRHPIEANSVRVLPLAWVQLICLRLELYGCDIPGSPAICISPLGLESGEIKDEALSIPDSSVQAHSEPKHIRLNMVIRNYPFGWQARVGQTPPDYLQIDFGSLRKVTRISTMGGYFSFFFVTSFELEYSNNGLTWVRYRENGQVKDLKGPQSNHEAKFPVLAKLAEPFVARYVRIIPNVAGKAMRAEIYGCFAEQLPPYTDVPEYARRSFLLDPVTDRFFACMYSDDQIESSCFSTVDGVEWIAVKPLVISVIASSPTRKEIYGLDRRMNFHRSCDSGETWRQITDGYVKEFREEPSLVRAKSLPENLVSEHPTADLTAIANSTGVTWGVSGNGIHIMTAGSDTWSMVGSWKCCGL
ncbi:uncharacterized protein [Montipora capricornis]|uniref:uncharacterized protein n=1 Tax=Montipora capricornis TaxID=246305 RepID=UPI0035F1829E